MSGCRVDGEQVEERGEQGAKGSGLQERQRRGKISGFSQL